MTAIDKTQALVRVNLQLSQVVKNEANPNKMSARSFDLLCDNLEQTGLTDPILVRPLNFDATAEIVKGCLDAESVQTALHASLLAFRVVGGHHRYDAATFLGFEEVPVTIIMDPDFDEEREKFQMVRMNVIRGKMDPTAFYKLYESMQEQYSDAILQDAFGFAEEAEFKRLIAQTAKMLPDLHAQEKFKAAAGEIKTVDGLSKLLNEMFTKYGDTLPHGYMVFDYGGQRSMWLRIENKTMKALDLVGDLCIENGRTMDDILGGVVQLIAKGDLKETVDKLIEASPKVAVPAGMGVVPTKDNLEKVSSL